MVNAMASVIHSHYPQFQTAEFVSTVCNGLEQLAFKQRSARITQALAQCLPQNFEAASEVLFRSLGTPIEHNWADVTDGEKGITGWAILPLADYVAMAGQAHLKLSMNLLKEMTKRSTAEFAIRPFLQNNPEQTLAFLHHWVNDQNEHVRRLVSEGSRPRLPWGMRLQGFIANPEPVLSLLSKLKDDDSEYVRRSVANNLNDIAKDHPDIVAEVAEDWLKQASVQRKRLIRHGCRTLIKQGHGKTLSVLGYCQPDNIDCALHLSPSELLYGSAIELTAVIQNHSYKDQKLIVDYVIHHQKANGSTSAKVFKWREVDAAVGTSVEIKKQHAIKPITTRVYYPGIHRVDIQINGVVVTSDSFNLVMPSHPIHNN